MCNYVQQKPVNDFQLIDLDPKKKYPYLLGTGVCCNMLGVSVAT